jgi:hypothetical protein
MKRRGLLLTTLVRLRGRGIPRPGSHAGAFRAGHPVRGLELLSLPGPPLAPLPAPALTRSGM